MRAPSGVTLALAAASVAMIALVHADPWASTRAPAALLSTQSMARRLFPSLGEADLARATIRLRSAAGELRLAPGEDGLHQLWRDGAQLGWADGEALAGLWGSLRMATTLRAVAPGSELGPSRGEIAVLLDGQEFAVQVGGATGDTSTGAGVTTSSSADTGSSGSSSDATTGTGTTDATTGEPAIMCGGEDPYFPPFDRSCVSDRDCSIVFHQIDCCDSLLAWGINGAAGKAFAEAEAECVAQYPDCDCPTQPPIADDGKTVDDLNLIEVACMDGECKTLVP